jgi:hypothetical protein
VVEGRTLKIRPQPGTSKVREIKLSTLELGVD